MVTDFQTSNKYEESQRNKQTNPLSVEIKFIIEIQRPHKAVKITDMFIEQEIVYGGEQGLNLYLKTQII